MLSLSPLKKFMFLVLFFLLLSACSTTKKLPLCPAVAKKSFNDYNNNINYFITKFIEFKKIEVIELSNFVAEYRGSKKNINHLERNYKHLLCAFDPELVAKERETFISCMDNANNWLKVIYSNLPEDLMLRQYYYIENCINPVQ